MLLSEWFGSITLLYHIKALSKSPDYCKISICDCWIKIEWVQPEDWEACFTPCTIETLICQRWGGNSWGGRQLFTHLVRTTCWGLHTVFTDYLLYPGERRLSQISPCHVGPLRDQQTSQTHEMFCFQNIVRWAPMEKRKDNYFFKA